MINGNTYSRSGGISSKVLYQEVRSTGRQRERGRLRLVPRRSGCIKGGAARIKAEHYVDIGPHAPVHTYSVISRFSDIERVEVVDGGSKIRRVEGCGGAP